MRTRTILRTIPKRFLHSIGLSIVPDHNAAPGQMPERLKQKTNNELFEVKLLGEESLMEMKAEMWNRETIGLESTFRSPNIVPHQRYTNQHAMPLVTS